MNKKFHFLNLLIFSFVTSVFIIRGSIFLDPDFGWHLRNGQMILSSGIPRIDTYTYTMPNFPVVSHEWLFDIFVSSLYPIVGLVGLSIPLAIMAVLSLFVVIKTARIDSKYCSLVFVLAATIVGFFSVRAQVISWFFFSLLIYVLYAKNMWLKCRKFTPILFLIWANFHGGFAAGILLLGLYVFLRLVRNRKVDFVDTLVLVFSVTATLVNPFGINLWGEIWSSISDGSLMMTIEEWRSPIFDIYLGFVVTLALSTVLIVFKKREIGMDKIIIFMIFLGMALASKRHIPFWNLVAGYMMTISIKEIVTEMKIGIKLGKLNRFKFIFILPFVVFLIQSKSAVDMATYYSEREFYPKTAITFLMSNSKGNMFAFYGWGGYLEWKIPSEKMFVDGRMPSWRSSASRSSEVTYAYGDYLDIITGKKDYKNIFTKYNITKVVWPVKSSFPFIGVLIKDGWKQVYKDDVAFVLQSP